MTKMNQFVCELWICSMEWWEMRMQPMFNCQAVNTQVPVGKMFALFHANKYLATFANNQYLTSLVLRIALQVNNVDFSCP